MSDAKTSSKTASLRHERHFYSQGCRFIVGMDEAGRGPWAGPVTVGAVCLPLDRKDLSAALRGVRDSKQLSALQRDALVDAIKTTALGWGIGSASAEEISALGINPATKLAMARALDALIERSQIAPDCLFLDYMIWPERRDIPQVSIIGGDRISLSIAAASILAKTWRDAYMIDIDSEFPYYGFAEHKGYGTPSHRRALVEYGPSPLHRMNYKPVQDITNT